MGLGSAGPIHPLSDPQTASVGWLWFGGGQELGPASPSCFYSNMGISAISLLSLCEHWVWSMLFLAAERVLWEGLRTGFRDVRAGNSFLRCLKAATSQEL